jgi:Domain of unknown function (DUF222)
MTPGAVAERAAHIAAVRIDECADGPLVKSALIAVREITSWAAAQQAALVAKLASMESFPEATIAAATKESLAASAKTKQRSDTLVATPQLADSLGNGAITPGHIDAVTRASKQLDEAQRDELLSRVDDLAGVAEASTIEQFARRVKLEVKQLQSGDGMDRLERQRRATRLRSWTDDDGMFCLSGRFDPVSGVRLHAALDRTVQALFAEAVPDGCPTDPIEKQRFLTAHALLRLAAGDATEAGTADPTTAGTGPVGNGSAVRVGRPEFVVVIDADATGQPGPVVEWAIPVEVPARVLADLMADAQPNDIHTVVVRNGVVLHAPGNLDLGRTTRLANRAQRRALRGLYRHCVMPGCNVNYDRCKLHHIIWWRNCGRTDLANLVPVCSKHHGRIHNDGWVISLGPNRQLTLRLPDGTIQTTGPPNRSDVA